MDGASLGGFLGFGIGLIGFFGLRRMAADFDAKEGHKTVSEGRSKGDVLRIIAFADVVIMTVIGYVVGGQFLN